MAIKVHIMQEKAIINVLVPFEAFSCLSILMHLIIELK